MNLSKYLIFHIHYKTTFGQNIYVVGNIPELGAWNVQSSVKLQWA